jgi:hypothetical protein
VVTAEGNPALSLSLNTAATGKLSTGLYQATVNIFLSNGGQDSFTVQYRKTSPSGLYAGRLSIYRGDPSNLLGNTNVTMKVFVDRTVTKQWDTMLSEQGFEADGDIRDITSGYFVTGYIDGNDSMVFDQPKAHTRAENKIPVRGLYSPQYGRMRLIAAVDIPTSFCRSDSGDCAATPQANEVRVTNSFGRPIRRVMHFIGPFDEKTFRFHGLYRETIHGLAPAAMTLDGGFQLDQWKSDESPVCDVPPSGAGAGACYVAPLYATLPAKADFPVDTEIQSQVKRDVATYCRAANMLPLADALVTPEAFASYLGEFCEGGAATSDSCTSYCSDVGADGLCDEDPQHRRRARVLTQMVRLERAVSDALTALDSNGAGAASLTLNDFLRGKIVLCSDNPGKDENCIDENQALCGMALHRRALLTGAVSLAVPPRYESGVTTNAPISEALFCGEGPTQNVGAKCRLNGARYPSTVALQEHNRFYKQLTEATRYQAANELSDAVFAMYRAANNQLERAQVLSSKQSKLQSALGHFNAMETQMFSPVSTALMFAWPMERFDSHGQLWLQQLHSVLKDRLDVVSSLIDLKRRVLASSSDADFNFVQHFMHMEYLGQAYLMLLQQAWERDEFAYAGQGPAALDEGQAIVSRVTGDRNPLGLHPSQIFFENANLATSNWKNYRAQILGGAQGAGLLAEVRTAVQGAVVNLKASLQDQATFINQIQAARQQFEQTVDSLCGAPAEALASTTEACEVITDDERKLAMSCSGEKCLSEYLCTDSSCEHVDRVFKAATGEALRKSACHLDVPSISITYGQTTRKCMRGQMGDALRQREQLHLQRKQIVGKINALMRQMAYQVDYINQTMSDDEGLLGFLRANHGLMMGYETGIAAADFAFSLTSLSANSADCLVILGLANGTDCVGKIVKAGLMTAATIARSAIVDGLTLAKNAAALQKETKMLESQQNAELRRERMVLDNMTTTVENYIAEYETVTNSLFSVNARIEDTKYLAEQAGKRYQEVTGSIMDHLIGGMNGDVLQRNKYVQEADAKFDDLLLATYKLSMAFVHSYNLKAQSDEIVNRVFRLMTPEDVAEFLADLDRYEANYCGGAGIDCDSVNNVEAFRFSVREQLFPELRDIVDSRTGAVLTKGEQFHNIITSDAYLRTRERAGQLVRQIEIPFSIWLNDRGTNGGYVQQWMVSPLECNHIIAPGPSGTIAVNVIGTRLRNLTYELGRGNTDYIRSCDPVESVSRDGVVRSEYPINTFIVGYAPQNSLSQKEDTPAFVTHSNGLLACKNVPELGGNVISNESCFKYFARERSLGAPDWTLSVPFGVAYDNDWVFGTDHPIIEDVIIYIRYRTRPI